MIDLGTLAGLLEHEHTLAAYCPHFDRWAQLDLAAMVSNGQLQVRPPVPTRPASGGWISVPAR
jgi:hypothetical protein